MFNRSNCSVPGGSDEKRRVSSLIVYERVHARVAFLPAGLLARLVQALLKPFEHSSLRENHYSQQLFNMANNL